MVCSLIPRTCVLLRSVCFESCCLSFGEDVEVELVVFLPCFFFFFSVEEVVLDSVGPKQKTN